MSILSPYNLTLSLRICWNFFLIFLANLVESSFVQHCLRLSSKFKTPDQDEKDNFLARKKSRMILTHQWNFNSQTSFFQFAVKRTKCFEVKSDVTFPKLFFQLFGKVCLHFHSHLYRTCFEKMFWCKSTKNTQIIQIFVIFELDPKCHTCLWKRF